MQGRLRCLFGPPANGCSSRNTASSTLGSGLDDHLALPSSKIASVVVIFAGRFRTLSSLGHLPMAVSSRGSRSTASSTLGSGLDYLLALPSSKTVSVVVMFAGRFLCLLGPPANGCSSRNMASSTLGSGWIFSFPFLPLPPPCSSNG